MCNRKKIHWDKIYYTAKLHGVAPLIYLNLQKCTENGLTIPPDIADKFKLYLYTRKVLEIKWEETLKDSLYYFHQRFIDVMLIKGAALNALVYKHPWLVNKNDLDIIIRPGTNTPTIVEKNEIEDYIRSIRLKGIECDYFHHHDIICAETLPIDFANIWHNAKKIHCLGYRVYVMSPEDMLIIACINSKRKRFFRLKSLFDIAEIIRSYPDLNWEDFVRKAKKYRCNILIYTALFVTKKTIGCNFPETVFKDLAVFPVRKSIIHLIIRHLNLRMPLTSLYPFSEENPLTRKTNLSLALPFATFQWQHFYLKIFHNKKKPAKNREILSA
ncbi:MAG: nucleotidyltransferase family protein [Candidatus Kuenenia sp.]|nr:nucleotidyltransferase family protein [Candidatus Kuenenia hertensis]